ncbi:phosphonate C-P lyase system protein PhnH [Halarcobacter anaerophilus]|jgi:alpha-D-ribose 1-methylphosphonate 5-triphosphate synthase subunit PhnH|uniref:phosphonate C-P lyase system protein PhnH n=1 Tax=Halarcobacter anaerophilus TaxID=877500 RepID=UPI0005C82B61|nr:phosphonate C-P lyase system protein PhnH [Halarcobacter anaerophilus]
MDSVDIEKKNRKNFRSLLDVLSMPGTTSKVNKLFDSYVLSVGSVLLYSEVSYINKTQEDFSLIDAITNAQKKDIKDADYIFCNDPITVLEIVKKGTHLNPDFSATIICVVDSLEGIKLNLKGPGIDNQKEESYPIEKSFVEQFNNNNQNYPLGNEIYFLNKIDGTIKALSRTTKLELV